MTLATFKSLIADLVGADAPRVWSLLVTVFGDLAQTGDMDVSSGVLNAIAAQVGLKPEATRVALHRLRKDGWIEGRRVGRRSSYTLTDWGRSQSAAASPLIYRTEPLGEDAWLVLHDPTQTSDTATQGGVWINNHVALVPHKPARDDVFSVQIHPGDALPDWIRVKFCPASLSSAAETLHHTLRTVKADVTLVGPLTPLQVAVLRVLIVHAWRRIILRTPKLPDHVFPSDWKGSACRVLVADVLEQLPRPSLAVLNRDAAVEHAA